MALSDFDKRTLFGFWNRATATDWLVVQGFTEEDADEIATEYEADCMENRNEENWPWRDRRGLTYWRRIWSQEP